MARPYFYSSIKFGIFSDSNVCSSGALAPSTFATTSLSFHNTKCEGECVANFADFLSIVSYCTFIPPENRLIFATSFDCNANVWDSYSGRLIARLEGRK